MCGQTKRVGTLCNVDLIQSLFFGNVESFINFNETLCFLQLRNDGWITLIQNDLI